jgi:glutamyl-tRNA synthetase
MEQKVKDAIFKYALQNAVKFKGKANPGAIIGRILGEFAELRGKTKEVMGEIKKIIEEVNEIDLPEQVKKLQEIAPELLEKKEAEEKGLPDLPKAQKGDFVTRIPPEPSKYNHLGHALTFLLNYMYAKKYEGKCNLRFEDTNPLKATQEYVDAMKSDVLEYLDIKPDKISFISDDLEKIYKYAEKLIKSGDAYVCKCDRDKMQDLRHKGEACECRSSEAKDNMLEWESMKKGKYKEGQVSLRLMIDMQAENQVLRDPVIFRIINAEHYKHKNKYKVWPMYDFAGSIEEHLGGTTHILRSAEYGKMREELQNYIKDILKLDKQVVIQYGRFNVIGAVTQGREIRKMIEDKKVMGWDDPRLVTLKALKRRGIVKEMYYELVHEVGLSAVQTNIDWKMISAINRRILDPTAHRYFFMKNPVKIKIENAPEQDIELNLHPETHKGGRKFKVKDEFFIEKADLEAFEEGKLYRLMDCVNFRKESGKFVFDSAEYEKYKEKGAKIMHWLPADQTVKAEVLMPDAETVKGIAEPGIKKVKEGDVIQFERFGFCRLDDKKKLKFWYTHK